MRRLVLIAALVAVAAVAGITAFRVLDSDGPTRTRKAIFLRVSKDAERNTATGKALDRCWSKMDVVGMGKSEMTAVLTKDGKVTVVSSKDMPLLTPGSDEDWHSMANCLEQSELVSSDEADVIRTGARGG